MQSDWFRQRAKFFDLVHDPGRICYVICVFLLKKKKCFSPRRSALGKTLPSVLSTAEAADPRPYSRPQAQFFPMKTSHILRSRLYKVRWPFTFKATVFSGLCLLCHARETLQQTEVTHPNNIKKLICPLNAS